MGDAAASPPISKRDERYYLIERRCKDLCLYLDVLTRNMPRYEKYILSAKMREIGYLCLELEVCCQYTMAAVAYKPNRHLPLDAQAR